MKYYPSAGTNMQPNPVQPVSTRAGGTVLLVRTSSDPHPIQLMHVAT